MFSVSFWQDLLLCKYRTGKTALNGAAWSAVEEQGERGLQRGIKKAPRIVKLCP